MDAIETRLAAVERSVRRWQKVSAILLLFSVAALGWGAARAPQKRDDKLIDFFPRLGTRELFIQNSISEPAAIIRSIPNGVEIGLLSPSGKGATARIESIESSAMIGFFDGRGKIRSAMGWDEKGGGFAFVRDEQGRVVWRATPGD